MNLPRCIVVRSPRGELWHHRATLTVERSVERIVAALGGDRALADRLAAGLAAARLRWPHAPAVGDELVDYLVARLAMRDKPDEVPVEDLFLAWWAGTGDSAAIVAFEAAFAPVIARLVARFHQLPGEELRQRLRIKLFASQPAKIHDYTGAGALGGWLHVVAARTFVDATRSDLHRRVEVELDEVDVLGLAPPAGSIRDAHQRAELSAAIKHAFAGAVSRLASRERTFLRLATVDGLTLDQIAATYKISRATVARTLKSSRERLLAETRAGVVAKLDIEPEQLDSALGVLDSKLDLSLSHVLRESSTVEG